MDFSLPIYEKQGIAGLHMDERQGCARFLEESDRNLPSSICSVSVPALSSRRLVEAKLKVLSNTPSGEMSL